MPEERGPGIQRETLDRGETCSLGLKISWVDDEEIVDETFFVSIDDVICFRILRCAALVFPMDPRCAVYAL